MDLIKEILNSEFKDRVLGIIKLKKGVDINILAEIVVYSSVIKKDFDAFFEEHKKEIEEYDHYVVFISDFDIENIEEKIKLKVKFYEKFIDLIKKNNLKIWLNAILIEDFKQISMDSKFYIIETFANGETLYDKGFIEILKLTDVHKKLIINDLQKYVVAYVLAGSQVKGRNVEGSDVDVYVVIDDTDVKLHTFEELKAKLYALVIDRALHAKVMLQSKKVLHPQVYTLTEFWYEISQLNPVIITFLRDGIALYDRGMYIAWKQLLLKGILKPSKEASEKYMNQAELLIRDAKDRIQNTLNTLTIENLAVSVITAGQSVLISYGFLPPDPKETPMLLRKIFVQERKVLEEEYIKDMEELWNVRKKFERGELEKVSYEDYVKYLEKAEKIINRLKALKQMIDREKEFENVKYYIDLYNSNKILVEQIFKKSIFEMFSNEKGVQDMFNKIENEIKLYLEGKRDVVSINELIENIKRGIRLLNIMLNEYRNNLILSYMYTVNANNQKYKLYLTSDKLYLISDRIYIYDYSGNKLGELSLEAFNDILKDLSSKGKNTIDANVINALSKIFNNFSIEK